MEKSNTGMKKLEMTDNCHAEHSVTGCHSNIFK